MFRMTDHRIRKQITDKQTNAGEIIENKMEKTTIEEEMAAMMILILDLEK